MLASLIAGFASGETIIALRRARNAAVAYGIAAICGLFGFLFLLVAGYVAAAHRFGAIPAALGFAGVFIVLAVLIIAFHGLSSSRRARVAARQRNSDMTKIAIATGIAVLPSLLTGRGGRAALIAPAIAAVAYAIYKENARPRRDRNPES